MPRKQCDLCEDNVRLVFEATVVFDGWEGDLQLCAICSSMVIDVADRVWEE